jgi:radical SAM superfamily enzyme YgiQ (UPF0313 family)
MNHAVIFSVRSNPWERSSGAHRIATYLRKNGMDIEVVDFTPYWDIAVLKEFVKKSVTDKTVFFGFSIFFTFWNQNMTEFLQWLKETYPHIKTVAGGQGVLQTEVIGIDIWIDSYGETAILELAKKLAGNSTAGIVFSTEYFGSRKVIKALQSYPSYNLDDYSVIMESRDHLEPWEWLTVEFSRGCKFSCAFCNFPILGVKHDTSRTKESFEYEMKYNYDNFGIDRYYVADETFNDRIEKISKFADVVESLDFDPFFSGFIRADLLSKPGMIEELARMNFGGQYYGVETFNQQSGKVVGKGLDPERVKKLILDTKDYFLKNNRIYRGTISLIVGLPYDTVESWKENSQWLRENWISEGLIIFPLLVEDISDGKLLDQTNASKFAQNLKKYGFRSMGTATIDRFKSDVAFYDYIESSYSTSEVIWEHDTMNLFEAKKIAADLQNNFINEFSIDSWCLSWPEILKREKLDLESSIHINRTMWYPYWDRVKDFVKTYSYKKLNNQ